MRARFLLGPAGSGKTFRCLTEICRALRESPEGPPLLLLAPKQTTYQLERQLLAEPSLPGFTRLRILSFERLAGFVFDCLGKTIPDLLEEEGRVMVLRGLLAKRRGELQVFRASARLAGFAQELSLVLRELQRNGLAPDRLRQLAAQTTEGLRRKLEDLATLLEDYLAWLKAHDLQDADGLLEAAAEALTQSATFEREARGVDSTVRTPHSPLRISCLWVDGFVEWSAPELGLLEALLPHCEQATVTFCLERAGAEKISWLSSWSVGRKAFEECRKRLEGLPGIELDVLELERRRNPGRFADSPVLRHLEESWAEPKPFPEANTAREENRSSVPEPPTTDPKRLASALRVVACANPEGESVVAAREVLRHVRAGGRYRDVTVLVRKVKGYHEAIQRVFAQYDIPFFLDRRQEVAHHPLAELTRSALRTVAFGWVGDDWFAALKTGLVGAEDREIDELENEALARGWKGAQWHALIQIKAQPKSPEEAEELCRLETRLENLRQRIIPPFQKLSARLTAGVRSPTGPELAAAVREFWGVLKVEEQLKEWSAAREDHAGSRVPGSVHATVWDQMNGWLDNVALGFTTEALSLREWLPILEAGLGNLTVGIIPPALDQVAVGAIDRSRNPNPDIKLALVLGLNEGVFPAPPQAAVLLSDLDRMELEKRNVVLGATARQQLGRERYLAYMACTRARDRLVLTCARQDSNGGPLNPSPFLSHVKMLFPALETENAPRALDWRESEHASELIGTLLRSGGAEAGGGLSGVPEVAAVMERLAQFRGPDLGESLAPELAGKLYGPVLRTSVSRMEQFAACPFKFFVHSGLRAEERKLFELDKREEGSFQHDALAFFHEELRRENKQWRDLTPQEARQRMGRIARGLTASYREGLLQASEQSRFMARLLTESLQDFVETVVGWMGRQYRFDPVAAELAFGADSTSPAWAINLEGGRGLELYGRIDRVDLCRAAGSDEAWCVVLDYKSGQKQLDPVLMAHGLQLQLLTYLNVVRRWPNSPAVFGAANLVPAGVFYVSLRGRYERGANRADALAGAEEARRLAYRHTGRFDSRVLRLLDARSDAQQGDQFSYRLTKDNRPHKGSREAMAPEEFAALLDLVESQFREMAREIFLGRARVEPYRKGPATACDQCDYRPLCRIDPWTHSYRVLKKEEETAQV